MLNLFPTYERVRKNIRIASLDPAVPAHIDSTNRFPTLWVSKLDAGTVTVVLQNIVVRNNFPDLISRCVNVEGDVDFYVDNVTFECYARGLVAFHFGDLFPRTQATDCTYVPINDPIPTGLSSIFHLLF